MNSGESWFHLRVSFILVDARVLSPKPVVETILFFCYEFRTKADQNFGEVATRLK
jgi:hypothetical protein